jgi:hypothetical protein
MLFMGFQLRDQKILSRGKTKKGDEVDDDDLVRTGASQNRATAALSIEELFLCTQSGR